MQANLRRFLLPSFGGAGGGSQFLLPSFGGAGGGLQFLFPLFRRAGVSLIFFAANNNFRAEIGISNQETVISTRKLEFLDNQRQFL